MDKEEIPIEVYLLKNGDTVKYVRYEDYEKLHSIIEELEKYLIEYSQDLEFRCYADTFLEKIQELKEKE